MAPSIRELDKMVPVKDVLAQQEADFDCLPCKLMGTIIRSSLSLPELCILTIDTVGSAAFTGLGIYSYASGMRQLREREVEILRSGSRFGLGARRWSIFGLSATLVGVGAYRMVF